MTGTLDDSALLRTTSSSSWAREFPNTASARSGGWEKGAGTLRFCNVTSMTSPARDVRELWLSLTDALAAGAVPSDGAEDLEYALQGASSAAAVAPHLVGVLPYAVGCGSAIPLSTLLPSAIDLLAYLNEFRAEPLRAVPLSIGATTGVLLNDATYQEASSGSGGGGGSGVTTVAPTTSNIGDATNMNNERKRARTDEPSSTSTLPSGWTLLESKTTGRSYYFHSATNRSSWEKPT